MFLIQMLIRVCRAVDKISEWIGKSFAWLVLPLVFILCYEIIARGLFNAPTFWAHELSQYVFGGLFTLCGAYALKEGSWVNVDIIMNKLKKRTRAIIDCITAFVSFSFLAGLIWRGSILAADSIRLGERSNSVWSPPVYPLKLILVIGAIFITLQLLAKFTRDMITAISAKELP